MADRRCESRLYTSKHFAKPPFPRKRFLRYWRTIVEPALIVRYSMISGAVAVVLVDYLLYIPWIIISISIGGIVALGRTLDGEGVFLRWEWVFGGMGRRVSGVWVCYEKRLKSYFYLVGEPLEDVVLGGGIGVAGISDDLINFGLQFLISSRI